MHSPRRRTLGSMPDHRILIRVEPGSINSSNTSINSVGSNSSSGSGGKMSNLPNFYPSRRRILHKNKMSLMRKVKRYR